MITYYHITNFVKKIIETGDFLIDFVANPKKLFNILDIYFLRNLDLSFLYVIYNYYTTLINFFKKKSFFFFSKKFFGYLTAFHIVLAI